MAVVQKHQPFPPGEANPPPLVVAFCSTGLPWETASSDALSKAGHEGLQATGLGPCPDPPLRSLLGAGDAAEGPAPCGDRSALSSRLLAQPCPSPRCLLSLPQRVQERADTVPLLSPTRLVSFCSYLCKFLFGFFLSCLFLLMCKLKVNFCLVICVLCPSRVV